MEQINHGDKNTQIIAGYIGAINFSPNEKELLDKGIQLLNRRAYKQAVEVLNNAIEKKSFVCHAHYYLALALLAGRKPRKTDKWTVEEVENNLSIVVASNSDLAHAYVLWAIVKHGYYAMNGLIEKVPTSAELFNQGASIQTEHAKEILYHIEDPTNPYWVYLYNRFTKSK